MKRAIRTIIVACMLSLLLQGECRSACAQGASFLNINADARTSACGMASIYGTGSVNLLNLNPAGIAGICERELTLSHCSWISEMNYEFMGMAGPVELSIGGKTFSGAGGVTLTYLSAGSIRGRDNYGNLEAGYSAYDLALGLAYGQELTGRLRAGMNFKMILESIDAENARGFAIDLGGIYETSVDGLNVGLSVRNFGPKMKFVEEYSLPLSIAAGATYRTGDFILGTNLVYQPLQGLLDASFGGEFLYMKTFNLRLGYETEMLADMPLSNNPLSGLTCGAGLTLDKYGLDYAFGSMGELGFTHRVSFTSRF